MTPPSAEPDQPEAAVMARSAAVRSACAWTLVSLPDCWKALTWLMKALSWLTPAVVLPALRLAVALLSLAVRALPLPRFRTPAFTRALTWLISSAISPWADRTVSSRLPVLARKLPPPLYVAASVSLPAARDDFVIDALTL